MSTFNNPGSPALYVNLAGSSKDGHAHGGRDLPQPQPVNRRVQVKHTDHPATDRWIVLTTVRLAPTPTEWGWWTATTTRLNPHGSTQPSPGRATPPTGSTEP